MKKKLAASFLLGVLTVVAVAGAVIAAGNIKLIINGNTIAADVPPRIVNGRVLVPISTIAKELHQDVRWDAKNQAVIVNPDIWKSEMDISRPEWVSARNKALAFFIAYDEQDLEKMQSLLSEDFTSDREFVYNGGVTGRIVDFRFRDLAYVDSVWRMRVQVVFKGDRDVLKMEDWDFTFSGPNIYQGKIASIQISNERELTEYTVFPGLTVDNQHYYK
ncbi:MAG: hypothetical protein A9Z00_11405 [Thermobacillus sp. ZCTH02-B1]|uniref:stalk domain-containing protein n=1 Tax=Thermobacillus sp. ZCTH02-B1 TaxID=1858795 RepID=UPI000B566C77|nr:stalk domain-containing protein [Thermobacillus sp. ZCTH02-B1]OUM93632.1 MAG: hypothetical protein A9Z00_11405 [Thermobacillus sp. ZCTH02-B1]